MALRFSAVKLTAQEKSCELLVGGVPTGYEDLTGWTAFDNFLKDIDDEDKVNVQVDTYLYGEGEIVDADPAEVAYMKDFAMQLRREVMYYFWSKCEWEVLISPWVGGNDVEERKVDVAWQIMNHWDVFVDYTWNNRKKL